MTGAGRSVLALGSGVTLLGVMRILGRDGEQVIVLPDLQDFSRHSRWFRPGPECLKGVKPASLAQALDGLPVGTVLLPCSDTWLEAVSRLSPALASRYPASVAPEAVVETLLDKSAFAATMERLKLPHPLTRPVRKTADLDGIPEDVLLRSFLKPTDSQRFFARFELKAFRISGRDDAGTLLDRCANEGFPMILQEYVPGPPSNHYFIDGFVDRTGTIRALFARQRLRMSPADFGNSTLMVSVPLENVGEAPATLERLFAALEYRGIFSAEFKRDARSGEHKLLEVNARPWWYVGFAGDCGVNVCKMAVDDALEQAVPTLDHYAIGRRCVYPYYDRDAIRTERRNGRLNLAAGLWSWIGASQPVFRWSDPMPALAEMARMIKRRMSR